MPENARFFKPKKFKFGAIIVYLNHMHKFDLYVTSIPNNNAKLIIARHIAALNHSIPLQTAMSMAEKPPLLLFSNLELKDAEQHVARLKKSGIGFRVVESKAAPEESNEMLVDSARRSEQPANYEEPADFQQPTAATTSQKIADVQDQVSVSEHSADNNVSTINHQKNDVLQESNPAAQRGNEKPEPASDKSQQNKKPVSNDDDKKRSDKPEKNDKPDKSEKDKKQQKRPDKKSKPVSDKKLFSTKAELNKFKSGIRIGSFERAEQSEKKSSRKQTIIVMSIFIAAAAVLFLLPREKQFAVTSADPNTQANTKQDKSSDKKQNKKDNKKSRAQRNETQKSAQGASQSEARREVSAQQRHQSNAYVDSARTLGGDPESIIAFYKFAISFNPQNLAAWQGLLQAYRDLGRDADARSTEEQMRKLFGERVESIDLVVKPFGELIDTYVNDAGTYKVEYRSNKRSRNDITNDVFLLTRAVRMACSCENISIYASLGTGRGLLGHSGPSTSVHSLSAFSSQAQIIWLD